MNNHPTAPPDLEPALRRWVAEGIIDAEQADQIRQLYGDSEPATKDRSILVAVSIIGALLIAGGIISIFAYNWTSLSREVRTVMSILPVLLGLVVYGIAYFRYPMAPSWREGSSTFLCLAAGASLGLLTQTYHLADSWVSLLQWWLLLTLPLLYLMPTTLTPMLYWIGLTVWTFQAPEYGLPAYWLWWGLSLPPFLARYRENPYSVTAILLTWTLLLTSLLSWFRLVELDLVIFSLFATSCWLTGVYFIGWHARRRGEDWWAQPFVMFAVSGILLLNILLLFEIQPEPWTWENLWNGLDRPRASAHVNAIAGVVMVLFWLLSAGYRLDRDIDLWGLRLFPLLVLLVLLLNRGGAYTAAVTLATLYGGILGVIYLWKGRQALEMWAIHRGMLFILAIACARFFNTDWNLVWKGIIFIFLGLLFLGGHYWLARQLRVEKE